MTHLKAKKKRKPSTLDVTCNRLVETHRNTPLHSTLPHKHIIKAHNRNTDNDRLQVPTTKALFFLLRRLPFFVLFNQNVPPSLGQHPRWPVVHLAEANLKTIKLLWPCEPSRAEVWETKSNLVDQRIRRLWGLRKQRRKRITQEQELKLEE